MTIKKKKLSPKYKYMLSVYKFFSFENAAYDYDEGAEQDMFQWESNGIHVGRDKFLTKNGRPNGFAVGKHLMDVTLSMWKWSIKNELLKKEELYTDLDESLHPWLDKVL